MAMITNEPPADVLRDAQIGGGDFVLVGTEFLRYSKSGWATGKRGRSREIGCGVGRMAIPLTTWLTPSRPGI
jgi:hypothetical protein